MSEHATPDAVAGYREALQDAQKRLAEARGWRDTWKQRAKSAEGQLRELRAALADPAPAATCQCVCHQFPEHGRLQDALEALKWHQEKLAERSSDPRLRAAPSGSWECASLDCHTINPVSNWFCARCGTRSGDGAAPSGGTGSVRHVIGGEPMRCGYCGELGREFYSFNPTSDPDICSKCYALAAPSDETPND